MSEQRKALIICAYSCCGKSCVKMKLDDLIEKVDYFKDKLKIIDIDEVFRCKKVDKEKARNIAQYIQEKMNEIQIIFVPSDKNIRNALDELGIAYILAFPEPTELNEWVGRAYIRGDSPESINRMIKSWSNDLRDCLNHDNRLNIMLRGSSIGSMSRNSTLMRWLLAEETIQYIDRVVKAGLLPEGTFSTEISLMRAEGWRVF